MNSYTFNFKYFLIIFLIIITSSTIIALLSIENFLKSNLVNNKSIIEYKSLFLNGKAPWLAFGDSHTANSLLNSSIINNLGYASDNLDSISKKSFYRIKRLKPKGIILQATPHTFSFYRLSDNQQQKTKFLIGDNKYFFEFLNPLHRPFLINYLELIIKNFLIDNRKKSFKEEKWIEKSMQNKNYETSTRVQLHMPIRPYKKLIHIICVFSFIAFINPMNNLNVRIYKKFIKNDLSYTKTNKF